MTILYTSCPLNKIAVTKVDDSGNLLEIVQTVYPVVDPLPEGLLVDNSMTEWIDSCLGDGVNLLYALTSFWNKAHAVVTAFAIDSANGSLTKLGGSVSTQGYQAASGAFSPDGSTYVVGHHNCGTITILSVLEDGPPVVLSTLKPPTLTASPSMATPPTSGAPNALAPPPTAVHHVQYYVSATATATSPSASATLPDVLVVADCAQDAAILYAVDDMGHFDERPLAHVCCRPRSSTTASPGWMQKLFRFTMRNVFQLSRNGFRLRRAVLSRGAVGSSGLSFLYCIGELTNSIQVYRVEAATAHNVVSINPTPLQELVVAGQSLATARFIGFGLTVISELQVYDEDHMVLVGVRGMAKGWGSRAESGIRVLRQLDDGRLELGQWMETPGAVRHFSRRGSELFVGINAEEYPFVQKYALQEDGQWKLMGQAKVDMDVLCVVPTY